MQGLRTPAPAAGLSPARYASCGCFYWCSRRKWGKGRSTKGGGEGCGRGARGDLRRRGGRLNKRGAGVNCRTEGELESRLQPSPAEGVTVTEAEAGRWGWFVSFFRSIF